MSEMVERVARALCLAHGQDPDFNYDPMGIRRTDDVRWRLYENKARAAIKAMREPTEGMLENAHVYGQNHAIEIRQTWHDMIDEALK